jgi:hypothetical protein
MIAEARGERDAMAAAVAEAEHRADTLSSQLSAALSDLEGAKVGAACLGVGPTIPHFDVHVPLCGCVTALICTEPI